MSKRKKDPSKIGLGSSQIEGQGTTTEETGTIQKDSTRLKKKKD